MKKTHFYGILILVVIGAWAFFVFRADTTDQKEATDYKNATYTIAGEQVVLTDGISETNTTTTRYFGNEVMYDFNGDEKEDVAFLLTQETGGSGTFFYVVAALKTDEGYLGSEALFLGDRIAPQTTEVNEKGQIVVNYADRAPGESFAVKPSVGKSVVIRFDANTLQLGEVVQNFEGEVGPEGIALLRTHFINQFEILAVEKVGQPIEGFEPGMFLTVFSKLDEKDFDGVEAAQGVYTLQPNLSIQQHKQ